MFSDNKKGYKWLMKYPLLKSISITSMILTILLIMIQWLQIDLIADIVGSISRLFIQFLLFYVIVSNISGLLRFIRFKSSLVSKSDINNGNFVTDSDENPQEDAFKENIKEVVEESLGDDAPLKIEEDKESDYIAEIESETNDYFVSRQDRSLKNYKVCIYIAVALDIIFIFTPGILLMLLGVFFMWCVLEVYYLIQFMWSLTEFLKITLIRMIAFGIILVGYYIYIIIEIFINQSGGADFGLFSLILSLVLTAYSVTKMSGRFSDWGDFTNKDYSFIKHKRKSDVKANIKIEEKKYRRIHNTLIFLNFIAVGYMLFVQRLNYTFGLEYGVSLGEIIYYIVTGITIPIMVIIFAFKKLFKRDSK